LKKENSSLLAAHTVQYIRASRGGKDPKKISQSGVYEFKKI
jgi:hypothetical protein